jgi:fatty-acyl-CoA synthase
MQEWPLRLSHVLDYGSTVHADTEILTWTGTAARTTTNAEIGRLAARLAHGLRELGVRGDDRVATFCWNNDVHLAAYLAVPAMGAVLHPLNIRLPADHLAYSANQVADKIVLVDGTLIPALAPILPKLSTVEHVVVVGDGDVEPLAAAGKPVHRFEELVGSQPDTFDWQYDGDETEAAAICYSSGTVGLPKGVAYSHRSIWLHSMQIAAAGSFGFAPTTRSLVVVPMFHVMAWGMPHAAFMTGAGLLMPDRFLTPEPLAAMIAAAKPTHGAAVPSIWTGLLAYLNAHPTDTSTLKEVVVGGSACPESLMRGFDEHGIRIVHAWGMTETSPLGSIARPPAGVTGDELWRYRLSQGQIPASVQARIVAPDGSIAPRDGETVGELEVAGPWITGRYLDSDEPAPGGVPSRQPGSPAASRDSDRFDDGWLRTGDVGTLSADGYITLTDRAKDVIKSGGEWISSVELENHLMAHPAVLEAAVVGVPDPRWEERPLASVVLRDGATATPEELRDFLADRIPRWQLPERWTFLTEVPKTTVGKFDKKVIRRRYAEGDLAVRNLKESAPE